MMIYMRFCAHVKRNLLGICPSEKYWEGLWGTMECRIMLVYDKVSFSSTQQTWFYNQSILRLNFILFSTATCFGPHSTIIRQYYDRTAKVIELLNMDPYLVQHVHIVTCYAIEDAVQIVNSFITISHLQ
jgi:hypothetical protein